jgi:hypothetical protein
LLDAWRIRFEPAVEFVGAFITRCWTLKVPLPRLVTLLAENRQSCLSKTRHIGNRNLKYNPAMPAPGRSLISERTRAEDRKLKYSWQEAVVEVFRECNPENLPGKVRSAECAIAIRLCDPTPPGEGEREALNDALKALRVFFRL